MQQADGCVLCPSSYSLAESIDTQLKRVGQDLKDIIEQINTANVAQDDESPVSLGEICHMTVAHIIVFGYCNYFGQYAIP